MQWVLGLDAAGVPHRWLTPQDAACYKVKELVAWELGDTRLVLHGGVNAATGERSSLALAPIIAIHGATHDARAFRTPSPTRERLFQRDRLLCAYCGNVFREHDLTADHVVPGARGGRWKWTNLVSSCRACNTRKGCRTPEEARMPLLYVPYVPNRYECFILANRRILADQMEFLRHGVSRQSRFHS